MKECIFGKEDINATEVPIISSHLLMWNEKTGHGQMMDVESSYSDFVNCDRTGRRNAVPDIKGDGTVVGTSELTKDMAQMDLKAGGSRWIQSLSWDIWAQGRNRPWDGEASPS
ncbi:cAMP-dependent protein kinase inhibitor gamma isoform X1 [Pangasianodon hypophthalmus]|uniref:cAMP-dependent protein kinase inhibitor gamma isoform X1 n=1 Tax=Pangasianodon hypophthalmus TaxID=310915 RepID=UPI002307F3FB|nr:cAMP-dependent protein kinase inhibitor gamma isoform X1 [Pangasianodon hypophthalmus]